MRNLGHLITYLFCTMAIFCFHVCKVGTYMQLMYYEKCITSVNLGKDEYTSAHRKSISLTRVRRTQRWLITGALLLMQRAAPVPIA